jgi:hypothetical protein
LDDFIRFSSIGFFGPSKESPSGEWVVAWSDSDPEGSIWGSRESGHGRYILYNAVEKKLVLEGKLERPTSAEVANNGSFSVEDWHFGNELSGTFYVFSCSGEKLIEEKLSANILNSAISNNGLLAVCQTAHAPAGGDGDLLVGFIVKDGHKAFSINPPTGWAETYEFDEEKFRFGVTRKGVGTFFYDSDGGLLEPCNFALARLRSDRYEGRSQGPSATPEIECCHENLYAFNHRRTGHLDADADARPRTEPALHQPSSEPTRQQS